MRKVNLVLTVAFMVFISCAFRVDARMGETEDQSQDRYGAPVNPQLDKVNPLMDGAITCSYKYQGWSIRAAFLNGRTIKIKYSRIPTAGTSPQLRHEEMVAILEAESGKGQWKDYKDPTLNPVVAVFNANITPKRWVNSNGNTAYLETGSMSLVIDSPVVEQLKAAKQAQIEAQRKASVPKF